MRHANGGHESAFPRPSTACWSVALPTLGAILSYTDRQILSILVAAREPFHGDATTRRRDGHEFVEGFFVHAQPSGPTLPGAPCRLRRARTGNPALSRTPTPSQSGKRTHPKYRIRCATQPCGIWRL